jgi:hypothetical protein
MANFTHDTKRNDIVLIMTGVVSFRLSLFQKIRGKKMSLTELAIRDKTTNAKQKSAN